MLHYLESGAGVMVGTMTGPLDGALNEAEAPTPAESGAAALNLTEENGLRLDGAGVGAAGLTGPGDVAEGGSGERVGGVGEEEALSAATDARGGKHRRERYSST